MIKVHIPSFRRVDDEHERSYTVSFACNLFLVQLANQSCEICLLYARYVIVMSIFQRGNFRALRTVLRT